MALAKHGDTVRVHYICRLDDGTIFENTMNRGPMQFKIGEDRIIPAFEQAIIGMKPGIQKQCESPLRHSARTMNNWYRWWIEDKSTLAGNWSSVSG